MLYLLFFIELPNSTLNYKNLILKNKRTVLFLALAYSYPFKAFEFVLSGYRKMWCLP